LVFFHPSTGVCISVITGITVSGITIYFFNLIPRSFRCQKSPKETAGIHTGGDCPDGRAAWVRHEGDRGQCFGAIPLSGTGEVLAQGLALGDSCYWMTPQCHTRPPPGAKKPRSPNFHPPKFPLKLTHLRHTRIICVRCLWQHNAGIHIHFLPNYHAVMVWSSFGRRPGEWKTPWKVRVRVEVRGIIGLGFGLSALDPQNS